MRESVMQRLQEAANTIDFQHADFSFRRLREAAARIANLTEANAESSFAFLLRSAVQEFANDTYKDLPVIYENFVTMVTSKRRSEVYGGLYRPNLPNQVDAGEKFQDSSFSGFEREIVNYKYGRIEKFERELFDDDLTGQVRSRASNMGEGFRLFEEIYVLNRLFGLARDEQGVTVSATTYANAGGGTGAFNTTIGNRPVTFAALSRTTLEAAHVAMRNITDPVGRKMLAVANQLIVTPTEEFEAIRLTQSPVSAYNADTESGMVNPLQGRYTVHSTNFVPAGAWVIGDFKRGFVFQRRDPLEVTQENPQSGLGFIQEVYAFRARERFEADWIEPRFAYQGNDGTV